MSHYSNQCFVLSRIILNTTSYHPVTNDILLFSYNKMLQLSEIILQNEIQEIATNPYKSHNEAAMLLFFLLGSSNNHNPILLPEEYAIYEEYNLSSFIENHFK